MDEVYKSVVFAFGILLTFVEFASGALPCKETKQLFKDIKARLDTPLPIKYGPVFITIIVVVLTGFIVKTCYDVNIHRKRMAHINQWDKEHLGENGKKNEIVVDYDENGREFVVNQEEDEPTVPSDENIRQSPVNEFASSDAIERVED